MDSGRLYRRFGTAGIILGFALIFPGCEKEEQLLQQSGNKIAEKQQKEEFIPGKYIVVFTDNYIRQNTRIGKAVTIQEKKNLLLNQAEEVLKKIGATDALVERVYSYALYGFAAELSEEKAEALKNSYEIEYVERDRPITLGPPPGKGPNNDDGGGEVSVQVTPWGITRIGGSSSGTGKVAWIIDTGIDLDHPDLNVDIARSETFIKIGKDSKDADDNHGHGTHVAGTVAAVDNDRDVIGVAAGATVVAVKVLDRTGSGTLSGVIAGIDYVAANASPGDAANLSLGGSASNSLDDAVKKTADKGIFISIAAGNSSDDANKYSPARVEHQNVWTVSASDNNDVFAYFSNWSGPVLPPIDYAAPGVKILSLWKDGGTHTISGTSMAAPHVTGLLLISGGNFSSDGFVSSDPDGDPDPLAHL